MHIILLLHQATISRNRHEIGMVDNALVIYMACERHVACFGLHRRDRFTGAHRATA
jgi:hypothetical protein